jgi:putative oxidoreductase
MSNLDARLAGYHSPVLSAFRIIFGLLYTIHGTQKLLGWPVALPGGPVPVGAWPFWWAGLIETILGILITIGLFTRIAAFIASGEMAFAYFYQHWPPLKGGGASFWPIANGGELAIMFCFAFLLIATTGAGIASVDARRRPGVGRTVGAPRRRVERVADDPPRRRGGLLSRFRR